VGGEMRGWTLQEGAALTADMALTAKREGFLLSLYGSTLRGRGRDLDLIAVPWRTGADPRRLVDSLAAELGGRIEDRGPGIFAAESAAIVIGDRVIDIQVRDGTPKGASPAGDTR
jgi:hypothetical protein